MNSLRPSFLQLSLTAILVLLTNHTMAGEPLKVFLLVGQSNMQGHAKVSTLEHVGMDVETAPILAKIQDESGQPRVHKDVWISYLSAGGEKSGQLTTGFGADQNKIGPELTFGIYMQAALGEPILIIKTAWGGKSIHTDFRPPSAGPYVFNDAQIEQIKKRNKQDLATTKAEKAKATGHYYRLMVEHTKKVLGDIKRVYPDYDAQAGYELAGFVWFQGWNDMVDRGVYPRRDQAGGYDQYSRVLEHFIRDVRNDFDAPGLPFVIGVMGAGGPVSKYLPDQKRYAGIHQNFRDAMAAPAKLPEFAGNVVAVNTENYWDQELTLLKSRESKIKQQSKTLQAEGNLSREELQAKQDELKKEEFSERERKVLEVGISNFAFHYLGSGKVMAEIGKGFAEAFQEIRK